MNVELLRKVQKHILEVPERFDMTIFAQESSETACHTVACIAGWAVALGMPDLDVRTLGPFKIEQMAVRLLELPHGGTRLFYECDWPRDLEERYSNAAGDHVRQAAAASDMIDRVIAEYEATKAE